MKPKYIDAHSHIHFSVYDEDREVVLARMRDAHVWTIAVGVDRATSQEAAQCASEYEGVFATVGLHPNDTDKEQFDETMFESLVKNARVVGVGECGLDYYRNDVVGEQVKKRQKEAFVQQIEFSIRHDKPLMLHCRSSKGSMDAYEDALSILREYPKARGNAHFFSGNIEIAKHFIDIDFTLSFTGVITFAREYDEVVRSTPLECILAETDAPYVSPRPHRGKRNEPMYVIEVVKKIAELRGETTEHVRDAVVKNALRRFALAA